MDELRSMKLEDQKPADIQGTTAQVGGDGSSAPSSAPPGGAPPPPPPPPPPGASTDPATAAPGPPPPPPPPEPPAAPVPTVSQDPRYERYFKMLKMVCPKTLFN